MHQRSQRTIMAAVGSALAVAAALGTGVATPRAAAATDTAKKVTFTSQPAHSHIVAHYTVTPATRGGAAASAMASGALGEGALPRLSKPLPPGVRAGAAQAAAAANTVSAPGATPPLVHSFKGMQGSNVICSYFPQGCNPPDMALAASPAFVFQGVNTSWEVLDTTGHVLPGWPVSSQRFFNVPDEFGRHGKSCDPGSGNQPFLSDPRAFYDATDHRFWAATLQVEGAPNFGVAPNCPLKSTYWIAVSQTADPTGSWNVYEFDMALGQPVAADYTQIGVNRDAVFFSGNMFGAAAGSMIFYAQVLEANKADMEAGRANFRPDGFTHLQGTGPGTTSSTGPFLADTVQPVSAIGSNNVAASHDGVFVDTIDGPDPVTGNFCQSASDACRGAVMWRMRDPIAHDSGGRAPTFSATFFPNTPPVYFPPAADEPTCNACVDGNDLRIPAMPMAVNGTVYTGWGTGIDNRTHIVPGIIWAQIDLGSNGMSPTISTGTFNLSGDNAATYPAFMPDGNGNVVMLYETMGHSTRPGARYIVRRSGSPITGTGRVLKSGEASYRPSLCGTSTIPVCRWGDYEALSWDGTGLVWMAGEYTNRHTNPNVAPWYGRNWGTWMGAVG